MYRIVLDVKSVNYDIYIDKLFEMAKKDGGMKIPPMMNAKMLKMMPQDAKNKMIAGAIVAQKAKMIHMIETAMAKNMCRVKVSDIDVQCADGMNSVLRGMIVVVDMDYDVALDKLVPMLLEESDIPQILGEDHNEKINLENFAEYAKQQDKKKKEYYVLKSMSVKKSYMIQQFETLANDNGIALSLNGIKFMVQK